MTTITKTNFKNVLKILGFIENGSVFEKKFSAFNCSLVVDYENEKSNSHVISCNTLSYSFYRMYNK